MLTLSLFHSLPHLRNLKTKVCPTRTSRKTTPLEPRDLLFYFRRTSACDIVICNGRLNVQSSRVFKTRNHCFLGRTRLKPLIQWCGWIQLNVQFELNPLLLAENLVDEVKINMPHLPSGENVSAVQKKKNHLAVYVFHLRALQEMGLILLTLNCILFNGPFHGHKFVIEGFMWIHDKCSTFPVKIDLWSLKWWIQTFLITVNAWYH